MRHFGYTMVVLVDINSLQSPQTLAGVPFMVSHVDQGIFGCEDHAPFQLIMSGIQIVKCPTKIRRLTIPLRPPLQALPGNAV